MVKTEEPIMEHMPMFSSSGLYAMAGVGLNVSEGSNFQVFGQTHKSGNIGTRFGNSVFGSSSFLGVGAPNYNLRDE